jgi:flagellar P-ring protein FlgI
MKLIASLLLAVVAASGSPNPAPSTETRLKELVTIEGVRDNPLIGYGLVVGLNGTGDRRQTLFSTQSLANLLQQMGVTVPAGAIRVQNTAAVMVTATLPPFSRPGARIDVTVAAIGDAVSLQGGLLLLTSLRGVDGRVYSVAQGSLVLGGYLAGRAAISQTLNHPTMGRVPAGAIIEQAPPVSDLRGELRLQLRQADFSTATRIADAINHKFSGPTPAARADNPGWVNVAIPAQFADQPAAFIAQMERLTVQADTAARVVINERTGTIVMGREVRILPVTVMHGALTVEIATTYEVSQPAPFSQGSTEVVPQTTVKTREEKARNLNLPEGSNVEDLVRALNAIGATARDVIAILETLRSAGALQAELEIN